MNTVHAIVLGIVQGITEFLPVSSSAHLVLVPWLLKWHDPGLGFDVALHLGTLAAVLFYFRKDIVSLAIAFLKSLSPGTRDFKNSADQRMSWFLVMASVPGAVIGKLFEEQAETQFRNPLLIAAMLASFGLILLATDHFGRKRGVLNGITWWQALLIGLFQAFAIIPGVSRSGSTMAAALALGLTREASARFSFLLSIPIIAGAGILKIGDLLRDADIVPLAVGFTAAAISGFLAIKYMLRYVTAHSFAAFVWYRLILAAIIVIISIFGR